MLGEAPPQPMTWLLPITAPMTFQEDSESECESEDDITGDLLAKALADDENHDQALYIDMSWQVPVSYILLSQSPSQFTSTL